MFKMTFVQYDLVSWAAAVKDYAFFGIVNISVKLSLSYGIKSLKREYILAVKLIPFIPAMV